MTMKDLLDTAIDRALDAELAVMGVPLADVVGNRLVDDYVIIKQMFGNSYRVHPTSWTRAYSTQNVFKLRIARIILICQEMSKILCENPN